MRRVLAAVVLGAFIIVLGCSTGPHPDRVGVGVTVALIGSVLALYIVYRHERRDRLYSAPQATEYELRN